MTLEAYLKLCEYQATDVLVINGEADPVAEVHLFSPEERKAFREANIKAYYYGQRTLEHRKKQNATINMSIAMRAKA